MNPAAMRADRRRVAPLAALLLALTGGGAAAQEASQESASGEPRPADPDRAARALAAPTVDEIRQARELSDEATRAFDLRRYAEAIRLWEAAWSHYPHPLFRYNIADARALMGDPCAAVSDWQAFFDAVGAVKDPWYAVDAQSLALAGSLRGQTEAACRAIEGQEVVMEPSVPRGPGGGVAIPSAAELQDPAGPELGPPRGQKMAAVGLGIAVALGAGTVATWALYHESNWQTWHDWQPANLAAGAGATVGVGLAIVGGVRWRGSRREELPQPRLEPRMAERPAPVAGETTTLAEDDEGGAR